MFGWVRNVAAFVAACDAQLTMRLRRWRPPRWLQTWLVGATRGGDGWLWFASGLATLALGGQSAKASVGAAGAAAAGGIALFLPLKRLSRRLRPCARWRFEWAAVRPPDPFSFPSGHALTAFAVSITLGSAHPAALAALLFCAFNVAISRVLLGMHFLSDVLAGSALGVVLGWGALALMR